MTEDTRDEVERLRNDPAWMESAAASVHVAYLACCQVLGWEVKDSNKVPYASLPEDAKKLDRASVHAVLNAVSDALARSAGQQQRAPLGRAHD